MGKQPVEHVSLQPCTARVDQHGIIPAAKRAHDVIVSVIFNTQT